MKASKKQLDYSPINITMSKPKRIRMAGGVGHMGRQEIYIYNILVGRTERKRIFERPRIR
jgi:hypothetical protein